MKRNLILTTIHRIEFPAVEPFFRSLTTSGFTGDIVVFCSAINTQTARQIKECGARVIPFRFPGGHVSNRAARPWWIWKRIFASGISSHAKERLARIVFHLFYRRHLLYLDFLREHSDSYERIFLTDCRDVFFQADPFGWEQGPGLHVFLEEEINKLGTCAHHIRWISGQFGSDTLDQWADEIVSCAGTVFGDAPGIIDYLNRMVSQTMCVKSLRAADGDQGVHNYVVRKGAVPTITIHGNRCGPVLTLGHVRMDSLQFNQAGHVIDETGVIVPVLHQYDRHAQLRLKLSFLLEARAIRLPV